MATTKLIVPQKFDIEIDADDTPITVKLVGKDYLAHPPKSVVALRMAKQMTGDSQDPDILIAGMRDFLGLVFEPDIVDEIMDRLEAPDDKLDIPHILKLTQALVQFASKTPPTSSPA